MKEVKAYVCSYCGGALTTNYDFIIEHEKRCSKNPNRKICSCAYCIHSVKRSYDTTNRFGQPISKGYFKCTIGCEFEDFHDYCESFEDKRKDNSYI